MNPNYAFALLGFGRMQAIIEGAAARMAAMAAMAEQIRKSKRPALKYAKRYASSLRRALICVAGYHRSVAEEQVREWIGNYFVVCAKLGVTPPIVRVPRSLQSRLGRTIGVAKKAPGWDAWEAPVDYLAARAAAQGAE